MFDYSVFSQRNIGFVTESEQERLRKGRVFVIGVGGMGGTALACLARSGVGRFLITDIDTFEVSNLNRQVFSRMSVIGKDKTEVAKNDILEINPEIECQIVRGDWTKSLDEILPMVDVIVNGCDDSRATVKLMRKAAEHSKTVIDAYASTLPSVYVVKPQDPRPEVVMGYPTVGRDPDALTPDEIKLCGVRETEYVMVNSSTVKHVVLEKAAEMISGKRKRISFAPMVWTTGTLMAYEAVKLLLGHENTATHKGYFLNPYTMKVEHPSVAPVAWVKRAIVRTYLNKLASEVAPL